MRKNTHIHQNAKLIQKQTIAICKSGRKRLQKITANMKKTECDGRQKKNKIHWSVPDVEWRFFRSKMTSDHIRIVKNQSDLPKQSGKKVFSTLYLWFYLFVCGDECDVVTFYFFDSHRFKYLNAICCGHKYIFGIDDTINRNDHVYVCVNIDQRSFTCFFCKAQTQISQQNHTNTTQLISKLIDLTWILFPSFLRKKLKYANYWQTNTTNRSSSNCWKF